MVRDGLWKRGFPRPDYALGVHAVPGPVGTVASAPGVRMAGTDQFDVTFFGVGGHGSSPHLAIDPVVIAAQAVLGYQTIISRNVDPQQAAVLTVGSIEAGRDNNVIPGQAVLRLNTRWFTKGAREQMINRVDEINAGLALAAGVPPDRKPRREMKGFAAPLTNDKALVARVNPALRALLGNERVIDDFPSVLGSEDFQEAFAEFETPYVFALVGVAPPALFAEAQKAGRPFPYANHNPDFFVDLAAIPVGAKVNTVSVLSILAKP
jgi:hippurate hydrolase